jgi:TctA family transporter
MLDNLALGITTAFSIQNIFYCFIGCFLGTIVGVLPGISVVSTLSLLIPLTYTLSPTSTLIMMAGIYYGAQYGSSTCAILINNPGENSSVITCIDGYAMTRNGRPGPAIVVAGLSSFIAGCIATMFVAFLAPYLTDFAFKFGPAEYSCMMLMGLISIGILTNSDPLAGLAVGLLGILLGCVGTDVNSAISRFDFGINSLVDGVGVNNIAIGIFGVTELIRGYFDTTTRTLNAKLDIMPTKEDLTRMLPSALRGTVVGSILGLLPGGGAAIASYMSYVAEKKFSKNKDQIGNGAVEGVAAPEAGNNAAAQTGFIPLLALGLPENAVMGIMLAAMIVAGIQPGPSVITNQPELFWGLTVSMLLGNLILVILNVPLVSIWVRLISIPKQILFPLIFALCVYGSYVVNHNVDDIVIMLALGLLGYVFYILEIQPAPLMLGYVLGPLFEEYFRRSMTVSRGSFEPFVTQPICVVLLLLIVSFLTFGLYKLVKR